MEVHIDRIRALQEGDEEQGEPWVRQYIQMIARSRGFWKTLPCRDSPPFRLLNNTRECEGPRLMIFRDHLPTAYEFAVGDECPVPSEWICDGRIALKVAYGTLVPVNR